MNARAGQITEWRIEMPEAMIWVWYPRSVSSGIGSPRSRDSLPV